jgi:hypothetical protein
MPADDLTAADLAAGTADHGPIASLPRDGAAYTGHDVNGNTCKVWFERGVVQRDASFEPVWWSKQ